MQVVIDIDENVYTRLFDNDTEDYGIVNDDLFAIAKSIRKGTPLTETLDKIRVEIRKKIEFNSFNEGYVLYDNIKEAFDKYKAESEE